MSMTTTTYSTTTYITSTSPVTYPSPPRAAAPYDSPLPIYERYKAARQAWYSTQPRNKCNDKAYRKAKGLRAKYTKAAVEYALGWKEMGAQLVLERGQGRRDWTTEEINAYLDFGEAENKRIEQAVITQLEQGYNLNGGLNAIQEEAIRDNQAQQLYYDSQNTHQKL
ncbi:hypothetical protein FOTG_13383 [Fusarium oxysporum f. sp. vasinfectum 25433]|uniref:Uncharacterized protein n=1 Tax=Fusarium oxysporum f. sp. vasinfectum 25433 TaxID=1089449 RepID=X0LC29_FUSOX|nr:hypothetical protein FOTG_13383 [Fusarium oxysporum f. sp. vasinfectum 25433]